jgi:hypothetical protein
LPSLRPDARGTSANASAAAWRRMGHSNDRTAAGHGIKGALGVGARKRLDRQDRDAPMGADAMQTTYFDDDDTLVIRLSNKPIVREVSQDWNTHVSYAADGSVVETVILEAAKLGAWPLAIEHREAA